MTMEYQVGDKVVLTTERPNGWNGQGEMDHYLGQEVVISSWRTTRETFYIENPNYKDGRNTQWTFRVTDILGFAGQVDIEELMKIREKKRKSEEKRLQKAEEKRLKALEEARKFIVYKMEDIQKLVLDVFPDDRVDFQNITETSMNILILFPLIHITNSRDDHHDIKDIYVKFNISYNGETGFSFDIQGKRMTISLREYQSNYGHSHKNGIFSWESFCLGSSDFRLIKDSLLASCKEEDWLMLFYSLESYLSWESIEGGPYKFMKDIAYKNTINSSKVDQELERLIPLMPNVFSWNNGIQLIEDHPFLYTFYNDNSTIKSLQSLNQESLNKLLTDSLNSIKDRYNFIFKEQTINPVIYLEETIEENRIQLDIINKYNYLIKQKLITYNKNLNYESARKEQYSEVFGEVGVV